MATKEQLLKKIDFRNVLAGESLGDFAPTAGFSSDSFGLNLTKERGVINFIEGQTTISTSPTGNLIASTDDLNFSGNDKYFLDDDGNAYTLNGTTLTKRQTMGGTFALGTSDMVQFKLVTYITSTDAIHELTGSDLGTTANWWDGLSPTNRHPMEVVEKEMFIGDGNLIYYWDGTTSGTAFTLPTENKITSLRKHPDGVHLLAFTGKTDNFSHTKPSAGRVYYCNPTLRGASIDGWSREVELEAQVEGTRLLGGIVYCTWGMNFGLFDGNGLEFMKPLLTSGTTYSHSISSIEETLLVRDGRFILAFGNLGAGNVWYRVSKNLVASNINVIAYKGDNKLLFGDAATNLKETDLDNGGASGIFYSNRDDFDDEVVVKRIVILHDTATTYELAVSYRDLSDTENLIETISHTSQSIQKETINCDIRADIFQLVLAPASGTVGIKAIKIYGHRK
jgi:hypothetical protein